MQSYISCSKRQKGTLSRWKGFFLCWELKKIQNKDIIESNIENGIRYGCRL